MSEVARKTVRAAAWAFVSTIGRRGITLIGLALLARLLAPREFGLLAFAMLYIAYAETIGDLGTGTALVYWPDRRDDAAQVTFLMNVGMGLFWCLSTIFLAPFIADFFNSPEGTPLVRVLSLSFLIKYLGNTHDALAQKDLRFRARTIPEFGLASIKAAVSVLLAWRGFGAWSLVWGQLAGITVSTILLWRVVPWRPTFSVPRGLFGPMLAYGRSIIAVNVLAALMFQVDQIAVGRLLGVTALGFYQMATRIPETTIMVLLWVVSKVMFPAFAKMHAEGGELKTAYLAATRAVSALTLPAAVGLFFLARPTILAFFGPQWEPAAPILAALALYVGIQSLDHHAGDVLKATGRANLLAGLNLFKATLIIPAVIIGASRSAAAVAGALAIVYTIATIVTVVVVSRMIRVPLGDIARSFAPSVTATAAMAAALFAFTRFAPPMPVFAELVAGFLIGAAVYVVALRLVDPTIFAWARATIGRGEVTPSTPESPEEMLPHAAP